MYQKIKYLVRKKLLAYIINSAEVLRFIEHNMKRFEKISSSTKGSNAIVLMELNAMESAHIAYSYLAHVLSKKHNAKIVAYYPYGFMGLRAVISSAIRKFFDIKVFGVYKSFGTARFLMPRISRTQRLRADREFEIIIKLINNKRDLERFKINDVWIGDLIYDSYLMAFKRPTVDVHSLEFKNFFLQVLQQYIYWQDFFAKNTVDAICVSHCVYTLAIPLRIAVSMGIPAYQVDSAYVFQLNKDRLFAYDDFLDMHSRYMALDKEVRLNGVRRAEERILKRFEGDVGVDMPYSKKSAYGQNKNLRLIEDTKQIKILVATHCFFDSPHSYGNNLFTDFWEWLEFLGQMTLITNYDWYIKTHPDYLPGTLEIIQDFIARYPKFKLLPADSSHHQIIREGINFALTVYGTIGFEYAALGIPVINASQNNPHIGYGFNLNPKNMQEYRDLLKDLDSISLQINKKDVYEFYFMKYLLYKQNLFFDDLVGTCDRLGDYNSQFTPIIYNEWLREWSPNSHLKIIERVNSFINSSEFSMHYGIDKH